jgi:hypothetical protein
MHSQAFRNMAGILRARAGFNGTLLKFAKGDWKLGRNGLDVTGHQFVARVDWLMVGHLKWWDGNIVDFRVGYVDDGYMPQSRAELGDFDKSLWEIWNRGRDPWELGWHLPMFNQVSNEQVIWSTNTVGGRDCLAALLVAFADRLDSQPTDNKTLPIVETDGDSYQHPTRGKIAVPLLNIIGWAVPPATPRPPLPVAPKPKTAALPSPADMDADAALIDAAPNETDDKRSDVAALLDDEVPF